MSDLEYLRARLADYGAYGDEDARSGSDIRVRAFVGGALTRAQTRLAIDPSGPLGLAIEPVLMQCVFYDQAFVRRFQHAELSEALRAALVRSDRTLVEYAERAETAGAAELETLLGEIDREFAYRRDPAPIG